MYVCMYVPHQPRRRCFRRSGVEDFARRTLRSKAVTLHTSIYACVTSEGVKAPILGISKTSFFRSAGIAMESPASKRRAKKEMHKEFLSARKMLRKGGWRNWKNYNRKGQNFYQKQR